MGDELGEIYWEIWEEIKNRNTAEEIEQLGGLVANEPPAEVHTIVGLFREANKLRENRERLELAQLEYRLKQAEVRTVETDQYNKEIEENLRVREQQDQETRAEVNRIRLVARKNEDRLKEREAERNELEERVNQLEVVLAQKKKLLGETRDKVSKLTDQSD